MALIYKVDFRKSLKKNRPLALVVYAYATINLVAINGNSSSFITALSGRRQVYCGHVDEGKATSVPNVFACCDATRAVGNLTLAVAGLSAHRGDGLRCVLATVPRAGEWVSIETVMGQSLTPANES